MQVVHIIGVNRPPQSRKLIKNAFDRVDCFECRKCCRTNEGRFRTPVSKHDSNYTGILRKVLNEFPKSLYGVPGEDFEFVGNETCVFAKERSSGGLECGIYAIRPASCSETPFIRVRTQIYSIHGEQEIYEDVMAISSICPPMKQLEQTGVTYVTGRDLLIEIPEQGYILQVRMLSKALLAVLSNPANRIFTAINKELAFLIK